MKKTEYAIVDIETTGGNASGSRLTKLRSWIMIATNDFRNLFSYSETSTYDKIIK